MELIESLKDLNKWLLRDFGRFEDGRPMFRIIQNFRSYTEKQWCTHTNEGFELIHPEVREVPKYGYIKDGYYVLEKINTIDNGVETDLTERTPYEPLWTFMDRHGDYLPPSYFVAKIVIETMFESQSKGIKKYTNSEDSIPDEEQVDKVEKELFGNETKTTDALAYMHGVTVPGIPPESNSSDDEQTE